MAATHFKTVLEGANDKAKLDELCKLTYKEQAVWLLNAVWEVDIPKENKKGGELAESIWAYVDKASVIDNAKATGNALDEMEAHRFLEAFDEAHTVLQMRSSLRKTGALEESERPKEVPLTHFFLDKYEVDWHRLVNAPQGDNSAKIAEAQDKLQAVQDAFDASTKADAEATAALSQAKKEEAAAKSAEDAAIAAEADAKAREADAIAAENSAKAREADAVAAENSAKAREADAISAENAAKAREADAIAAEDAAKARESEAVAAEAPFKAAQAEVSAALAEVKAQEDAYNGKTEALKKQSEEGGVVTRNKAKVSLDAHLAEDPLPLRKAKITLEAANKRADKARAPFQAATEVATEARGKAEAARSEAEAARKVAEGARSEATAAREAAEAARAQASAAREAAVAAREAAEGARKAAEAARAEATASRERAEVARGEAEAAKARAEAAVAAAQAAVAEAEELLKELMENPGSGHGALWWIERELHEKKKYMPISRGGIRK